MIGSNFKALAVGSALAVALSAGVASDTAAAEFDFYEEQGDGTILEAFLDFSFFGIDATTGEYVYDVTVRNDTDDQDGLNSLTAFAINVDPDGVTAGTINTSSIFSFAGSSGNVGESLGTFELCYEVDTNGNCLGNNPTDALGEGESETFQLGFISTSELTFLDAFTRFQQVGANNEGSAKIGNCDGPCDVPPGEPEVIPLPAGLPLLLGGVAVFGVVRRMKRKAA